MEFDELVDDTVSPQHLRHPQDEVGCSGTFGERAVESETDDLGQLHHDRLSDHRRFGLDSTHAPPEYAQAVDHRGVRVSADQRVGEESSALVPQHFGEVPEVHLVDDPRCGGHYAEVVECGLAPLEKLVALAVALELALAVHLERKPGIEHVDLHGVIDDEIDLHQRIDQSGRWPDLQSCGQRPPALRRDRRRRVRR